MTEQESPTQYDSPQNRAWRRLRKSWSARIGCFLVSLFVFMALFANLIAPYAPNYKAEGYKNGPPTQQHWLGTDTFEYDVLTRVIYGSRLSLVAGLISITLAILIGVPIGTIAGYFGGWVDSVLMRTVDIALAFPSILVAMLVVCAAGAGWGAVIVAVGLVNVPVFARQVRSTLLTVRHLDYVTASRAMGAPTPFIMKRAILPSLVNPILVLGTLGLGSAILEVAGLSFLGIAGDPTLPEWGSMLTEAKEYLGTTFWPAIGPGAAISLTILGFNLLGDGLRDALDPRLIDRG